MAQPVDMLHTGNSGYEPTFGNEEVSDEQKEAVEKQQAEIAELMPGVEAIQEALAAEIEAVGDIRGYITSLGKKPDAQTIQDEYRARELYIELMRRLSQSIDDKVAFAVAEAAKR